MKTLFAIVALALLSSQVLAKTLSEQSPYIKINSSTNGTEVYVGAYGNHLPYTNENGVTIIRAMFLQAVAHNGVAKGSAVEAVYAVICDRQQMKVVDLVTQQYENAPVVTNNSDEAMQKLQDEPFEPVTPNTLEASVVDAGCSYVNDTAKQSSTDSRPKVKM